MQTGGQDASSQAGTGHLVLAKGNAWHRGRVPSITPGHKQFLEVPKKFLEDTERVSHSSRIHCSLADGDTGPFEGQGYTQGLQEVMAGLDLMFSKSILVCLQLWRPASPPG